MLAQHILGMACADSFDAAKLHAEIASAYAYRKLTWEQFEQALDFVSTGGYALKTYDRFAKLRRGMDGLWRLSHPKFGQQYRLNVGTIVEAVMLKVRLVSNRRNRPLGRGGEILGEIEETFIDQLAPGDTFLFAGQILRFEGINELTALVSSSNAEDPQIPAYMGGKFPLSTYLADRVRAMLANPKDWQRLDPQVSDWLTMQKIKSVLPRRDQMLIETFPRGHKHYLACYPFEGRLAHQTLGMLLTRRLERARVRPLGFVASEYALAIWGLRDLSLMTESGHLSLARLFEEDMLGDDLEAWLAESSLMKRTFKNCAIISDLIEKRFPGQEKSGRQVTFSADLIYDVLREHEPDHLLLKASWDDAATGLLDIHRLGGLLKRVKGKIVHQHLDQVSPFAVPVMLEIGKESVYGEADESLLAEAEAILAGEAMNGA